jgi:hypothetical protein
VGLKRDKVYYYPINVRNREDSKNVTTQNLCDSVKNQNDEVEKLLNEQRQQYETQVETLQQIINELEMQLKDKDNKVMNEMKMKSYYKTKPEKDRVSKREFNKLKKYIAELENHLLETSCQCNDGLGVDVSLRNIDCSVPDNVRFCAMALLGLEVAVAKVPEEIKVVGEHIFNAKMKYFTVLRIGTVLRISDEGQYLVKLYTAEKLQASEHFGVNFRNFYYP